MSSDGFCLKCYAWAWCWSVEDNSTWHRTHFSIQSREERRALPDTDLDSASVAGLSPGEDQLSPAKLETLPRHAFFEGQMVRRLDHPAPEVLFPALLNFLEDGTTISSVWRGLPPAVARPDAGAPPSPQEAFSHLKEATSLMGESVDLVHQINPALHGQPLHSEVDSEVVPWWYNRLKAGSYDLVTQGVILSIPLRPGGADDKIIDEVGLVLDLAQPVEAANQQASASSYGYNGDCAQVLQLRTALDECFSPARHHSSCLTILPVSSPRPERLPTPPRPSSTSLVLQGSPRTMSLAPAPR